jgi:hypothetical protein
LPPSICGGANNIDITGSIFNPVISSRILSGVWLITFFLDYLKTKKFEFMNNRLLYGFSMQTPKIAFDSGILRNIAVIGHIKSLHEVRDSSFFIIHFFPEHPTQPIQFRLLRQKINRPVKISESVVM